LFAVFIQIRGGEHGNAKSGLDGNDEQHKQGAGKE